MNENKPQIHVQQNKKKEPTEKRGLNSKNVETIANLIIWLAIICGSFLIAYNILMLWFSCK